ncbi:hypothetical protein CORMATOL_02926 [Corynebacterium matruchotii ATCC 33806]|uniref:Uncharacterized protein n=1 Tax=Corynebacterium matruchotii ATCC 33806 TaxID=566549 RepID=C0E7D7_9CORY|nr:hypothetical protein CORMATOL_02926 [Corynebacterium matruchotii ATCC 33806]
MKVPHCQSVAVSLPTIVEDFPPPTWVGVMRKNQAPSLRIVRGPGAVNPG